MTPEQKNGKTPPLKDDATGVAEKPQQMFSQREVAQFGVKGRPQISLTPTSQLVLEIQDPRSKEEKEQDKTETSKRTTMPMFAEDEVDTSPLLQKRTSLLKVAESRAQKAMGMLEELQAKPQVALEFLAPVLLEQAQELLTTIQQLVEPTEALREQSSNKRQSSLGYRSSHTIMLIDGVRVLQPL